MLAHIGLGRPSPDAAREASSLRAATRHPRKSSQAAYSVFDAGQIQTFKEAFSLMDQNNDGYISEADLKGMLTSLGQSPTPSLISSLLSSRPTSYDPTLQIPREGISFTVFVTMMAEHLSELDPEVELLAAFACFDEQDKGTISVAELKKWLSEYGDRMSDDEINRLLSPPFVDRARTTFNYRLFCQTLRVTEVEEETA